MLEKRISGKLHGVKIRYRLKKTFLAFIKHANENIERKKKVDLLENFCPGAIVLFSWL